MTRLRIAAALAGALIATPASAADKGGAPAIAADVTPSVSPSCYVQGLAGGTIVSANPDQSVLPASLSAQNWSVAGGVGCDIRFDRVVVGALARIEAPIDTSGQLIDLEKSWMAAIRVGYMVTESVMAYGLIGYESATFDLSSVSLTRDGYTVGGGVEIMLSRHLSIPLEYTYTGLGKSDALGVPVETEQHRFRTGLTWRFNSLFGE